MFNSLFDKFKNNSPKKFLKDPVCGMMAADKITLEYQGQTYAFCSDHCRQQFQKNPESYIIAI